MNLKQRRKGFLAKIPDREDFGDVQILRSLIAPPQMNMYVCRGAGERQAPSGEIGFFILQRMDNELTNPSLCTRGLRRVLQQVFIVNGHSCLVAWQDKSGRC